MRTPRRVRPLLALLVLPLIAGLFPQPASAASTSWTYVPVLMYHYIRINPDPRDRAGFALSVTPAAFHAQMDYLARNHFNVSRSPRRSRPSGLIARSRPGRWC